MATEPADGATEGASDDAALVQQVARFLGDSLELLAIPAALALVAVLGGWQPTGPLGTAGLVGGPIAVAGVLAGVRDFLQKTR